MLAIIWHSRTGASAALAAAAGEGAAEDAGDAVDAAISGDQGRACMLIPADQAQPEHFLAAAGYLFVCPENLAAMSGAMKEMFDRCYYPLLGRIDGRPYATLIAAGTDGRGALAQLDRIVTGWRLRRVAEPMIALLGAQTPQEILTAKHLSTASLEQARNLGKTPAAGLALGIF